MKVLLVEDDRIVRIPIRDALEEAGYRVTECADGAEALRLLTVEVFDIVLTDVRLPGASGLEVFRAVRRTHPNGAVLLMTAYADTDDAVAVIRDGAKDYISKPFEMDELLLRMARVRSSLSLRAEMAEGSARRSVPSLPDIRGLSPATAMMRERIDAAAASDVGVLITGETGTGKDLCARTIHARSRRAAHPFIAVNCAAIPETLFEAEFFGHEKGAFTGADRRRVGRFEAAEGGTLFLDEIGELPPSSQVKLLRAIETAVFEPLGSSVSRKVDVRIVAATNQDLSDSIATGRFRKDLFYRINVIDIVAPALRDRRADIPSLVGELLGEIAARQSRTVPALDPAAAAAIATYDYPGNVRELIHALERAVAVSRGEIIGVAHLPPAFQLGPELPAGLITPRQVESLERAVGEFERHYIQRVLDRVGGHRGRAAEVLGISRKSLWQRLRDGSDKD